MAFDIAITREVPRSIMTCELTHLSREPIDYDRAVAQHDAYCLKLAALGLEVIRLPADEDYPDCCFVEDAAIVLDEVAVLTSPGAASRRGELAAIAAALDAHRRIVRIELPATLDGGDVLQVGKRLYVGRTARTSDAGIAALRQLLEPFGYEVVPVAVSGCLHLKSAVTALDAETVLVNRAWISVAALAGLRLIDVAPEELGAANVLRVRDTVLLHSGFPRTAERLQRAGYALTPIDISEFHKAEAALTCKSLLFSSAGDYLRDKADKAQPPAPPLSLRDARRLP